MSAENGPRPEGDAGVPLESLPTEPDLEPFHFDDVFEVLRERLRKKAEERGSGHRVPGADILHAEESLQREHGNW